MSARPQVFPQPSWIPPFDHCNAFAGMTVGVTGARGVLGSLLCRRLEQAGIATRPFDGDVTDAAALAGWAAAGRLQLAFHFAAVVPVERVEGDPARAFDVNAVGAYAVCRSLALQPEPAWLFLASTSHVYQPPADGAALKVGDPERPASLYGRTKLAGEQLCRQFLEATGRPYCIGRIFSFTHATQQEPFLVPRLRRQIAGLADGAALPVVNPDSVRDMLDAETVIDAVLHLAHRRVHGTVNIGSGQGMSVAAIARHLAAQQGKPMRLAGTQKTAADTLVADVEPLRRHLA